MDRFFDVVGTLSWLCASIAKLLIGAVILLGVAEGVARNLGLKAMTWAISASEYSLLYITFLAMPWLVRNKGHVFVVFLRALFPAAIQRLLEKLVYLTCIRLCVYPAWVAGSLMVTAWQKGSFESRTFDLPKWAIYLPICIGFGLSALEWLRFLITPASIYDVNPLEAEGI